jgi:ELWxxDGT repeat protein
LSKLYYSASAVDAYRGLWVSDGTTQGTVVIAAGVQGAPLYPTLVSPYRAGVVFSGTDSQNGLGLWYYDGSSGSATEVTPVGSGFQTGYFTRAGAYTVFSGLYTIPGVSTLSSFDGQSSSTLLSYGVTGVGGRRLDPQSFFSMGAYALFMGDDPSTSNYGLWRTDGTVAGTTELASGLAARGEVRFGLNALFDGADSTGGNGLWITDGTAAGTTALTTGQQFGNGSFSSPITVAGGFAYFTRFTRVSTYPFATYGVWVTDGTSLGTRELLGGLAGPPSGLTALGSRVVFQASSGLWSAQGTTATQIDGHFSPVFGASQNGELTFSNGGYGAWITDGTTAGTYELDSSLAGTCSGVVFAGSRIFFISTDVNGAAALWVSNGVAGDAHAVPLGGQPFSNPTAPIAFGGDVVLTAVDSTGSAGVWISDGDRVTELVTGKQTNYQLDPTDLQVVGTHLMFAGFDPNGNYGEWSADAAGTKEVSIHAATAPPTVIVSHTASDFNGDGCSDILFENAAGKYATWQIQGATLIGGAGDLGAPGPGWTAVALVDLNGDGQSDMVFENTTTKQLAVWQMFGTEIAGNYGLAGPGGSWKLVGTGDFNGDGRSDLLFRDATGNLATWEMNGGQIIGGGTLGNPGAGWTLVGTGDFNGDGRTDLMFENVSGVYATWLIDDATIVGGATLGSPGAGMVLEGVGANVGDGSSTAVFLNENTGDVSTWKIRNDALVGGGTLGNVGSQWTVKGVGDYNGDGNSDILFYNVVTGQYANWQLNAAETGIVASGSLGAPGATWSLQGAAPAARQELPGMIFWRYSI